MIFSIDFLQIPFIGFFIKYVFVNTPIVIIGKWFLATSLSYYFCAKTMRNPNDYFIQMITSEFLHLSFGVKKSLSNIGPFLWQIFKILLSPILWKITQRIIYSFLPYNFILCYIGDLVEVIHLLNIFLLLWFPKWIFHKNAVLKKLDIFRHQSAEY